MSLKCNSIPEIALTHTFERRKNVETQSECTVQLIRFTIAFFPSLLFCLLFSFLIKIFRFIVVEPVSHVQLIPSFILLAYRTKSRQWRETVAFVLFCVFFFLAMILTSIVWRCTSSIQSYPISISFYLLSMLCRMDCKCNVVPWTPVNYTLTLWFLFMCNVPTQSNN